MLGLRHLVIRHAGPGPESLSQQLMLLTSLQTLSLENTYGLKDVTFPELDLPALKALRSGHLRHASISVTTLGTAEQPAELAGGLATVSKLELRAQKLHVSIPSGVTWSSISWYDIDELGIRHVHACRWECRSMYNLYKTKTKIKIKINNY